MPEKGKRYTAEFKEQAARKVVDNSLPIAQVARELGVNDTTLGFWVKDYRKSMPLIRFRRTCPTRNGSGSSSGGTASSKWKTRS